jgi:FkbM family methyltransferase
MTFVSYAQNFEDVMLWRALRNVKNGFYIDVGAGGPDVNSVTRAFYDRGWRGINIEPSADGFRHLRSARPRDINLHIALSDHSGLHQLVHVPRTGLSSLESGGLNRLIETGLEPRTDTVDVVTLAGVCRLHAAPVIHFLKVDMGGAESTILAGADFKTFRPWIVLVEAVAPLSNTPTHAVWEPVLLAAGYEFVWFDGLNRFYLAQEQYHTLQLHFRTPPNLFDDFLRVADSDAARRIATAETRVEELTLRAIGAEALAALATAENLRILSKQHEEITGRETAQLETLQAQQALAAARAKNVVTRAAADSALASLQEAVNAERLSWDTRSAQLIWLRMMLDAVYASSSWRVTAPIRSLAKLLRRSRPSPPYPILPPAADPPASQQLAQNLTQATLASRRAVHQFHSGSAVGDAITNAMFLMRGVLRSLGYRSEIFVEHRDQHLADELRLIEELPEHDDYVLIFRHSMGFDRFEEIMALAAPKILLYHNITPPAFLASNPFLQTYSRLGREQLSQARDKVCTALADSEYNATELRRLGFPKVDVCTLLFEVASLRRSASRETDHPKFTILFVGRIIESKGQVPLILAFARFRAAFGAPCRLVLVGRCDAVGKDYLRQLDLHAQPGETPTDDVTITGLISDEQRDAFYSEADLYVSLSRHEGFGVPLVEAMAHGIPVLAWPAGAIPYTLGPGAELLTDRAPEKVATHMLRLSRDPLARARIVENQVANLKRFEIDNQTPSLLRALALAGAAISPRPETKERLAENIHFEITGHFASNYSLASVNRNLALMIEDVRPNRVRVVPVAAELENFPTTLPAGQRARLLALQERPPHDSGPVVVISQHYPVLVPESRGDILMALFFWEESLIPTGTVELLSTHFDGILAPSRFVAKILLDSGCRLPILCFEQVPELSNFFRIMRHIPKDGVFTFLHVSSGFPRKGIDILLAAYAQAFRRDDKVRLVIKTFPNLHNDVASQVLDLRFRDAEAAEIVLVDQDLEEAELIAQYANADAIVLPTRGEGYNLPAAEALAAGRVLIVTGHGGHLDFCKPSNARLVDYSFAPSCSHLATPHSVWVEPDLDDLVLAMREVVAQKPCGHTPAFSLGDAKETTKDLADFSVSCLHMPPARISVAFVSSWNVRCGIAVYSENLVAALPESNQIARFTILADLRTEPQNGSVRILPVWEINNYETLPALVMAIATTDPDIVVIQHHPGLMPWPMLTDLLLSLHKNNQVTTVTLHNILGILEIDSIAQRSCLAALSNCARIIVHTIADLNRLKNLGLIDNVVLFPQGVLEDVLEHPLRALAPQEAPLIGSFGFLLPDKGLPQLIEAFATLRKTWPAALLRMVNAHYRKEYSDAELAACLAKAESAGVADAIEWHTEFLPIQQCLSLMNGCDILALPYQASSESSSAALRTALCSGAPVMVTPLALFDEAKDCVLRFDGFTSADIAAGLTAALKDNAARNRVKDSAKLWVEAHNWGLVAKRLQDMLIGLAVNARH